ncbi:MAG: urease accessory protein UreD [Acinetobacter sp.]
MQFLEKPKQINLLKQKHWVAQLQLGFEKQDIRTIMTHRKHFGPLRVQKMLWPEKTGVCHAIIVHPPAGIAGGDYLSIEIQLHDGAHAVVTTPGAGKWYKTNGRQAHQIININVAENAIFEWLPQEVMLFDGAQAHAETTICLHEHASFIGWDMLVIGRQASAESFQQGAYYSQLNIVQNDRLILTDRLSFLGNDRWLSSCLGMNNHAVMGSFWAVAPQHCRRTEILLQHIELIRELMMRMDVPVQMTLLDGVISARYLGDDVRQCHDAFAAIRARLRRYWLDLDEEFPRIWRT